MAQPNKEIVKRYHEQLTNIRVRFPAPDKSLGIPDYLQMIKDRAKEQGYIIQRGTDKGEGSANSYILHLIENDLGIEMIKGMSEIKTEEVDESQKI